VNKRPSRYLNNTNKKRVLLVDGNSLFKRGFFGAKNEFSERGDSIGGIYQFLTVLRKVMDENVYNHVYSFWDGNFSGKLRWYIYNNYKIDRGKDFITGTEPEDPNEILQRGIVYNFLEELSVRQLIDEVVEADDMIAYYCNNRMHDEEITIITSDRDLCQLLSENVKIYLCDKKTYITKNNFNEHFKYHYENVALIKILCGDTSDSIKGIKGLGEDTLIKHFPDLTKRKMTLSDILTQSKAIQENRKLKKQKPLSVIENIINSKTNGIQGDNIYEINNKLINLREPLLTDIVIEQMEDLMNNSLSDDRTIKNAYRMLKENSIDKMIGENRIEDFLTPFKKLFEREKNNN
jgi:DNA polymerase-1